MKVLKEDYRTNFRGYGEIIVPKGTRTTHRTACGIDENYNFVDDFNWVPEFEMNGKKIKQYGLIHDLTYYGLDIPKEFLIDKE